MLPPPLLQFRSDLRLPLRVALNNAVRSGDYPPEFDLQVRVSKGQRIISVYPPTKE
jgi:hypothetical protein